jgi:hypothetical protein
MRLTINVAVIGTLGALLTGCAFGPFGGDLQSAREACNRTYPPRIGNYLPHADCVNAAVERFALPTARHPDLIRLQEEVRSALSDKVDRRRIGVRDGEHRMAEADRLITAAERDRDAGNEKAASRRIAAIEEMLR